MDGFCIGFTDWDYSLSCQFHCMDMVKVPFLYEVPNATSYLWFSNGSEKDGNLVLLL